MTVLEDMKKNWKRLACLVGGLWLLACIDIILVSCLGSKHVDPKTRWTMAMHVSFYDTVVSLLAYELGIFCLVRCVVRQLTGKGEKEKGGRIVYGIGATIFALLGVIVFCHELAGVACEGFTPDTVQRTIIMTVALLVAMGWVVDKVVPREEKKDDAKAEPTPNSVWVCFGIAMALFLVILYAPIKSQIDYLLRIGSKKDAPKRQPQQEVIKVSPPANLDELAKAFVCVASEDKLPSGSGLLVGMGEKDQRRVMMITAAHVGAGVASRVKGEPVVNLMLNNSVAEKDAWYSVRGNNIKWVAPTNGADIAILDLTDELPKMVTEGIDVKYVKMSTYPLPDDDPRAITGVVAVPRTWLGQYGIGLGTGVRVMGMAAELWDASPKKKRQPMAVRRGQIAARLDYFDDEIPDSTTFGPITIECEVRPGFSGGPVFANVPLGNLPYPVLIGVMRSVLKSHETKQVVQGMVIAPLALSGYAQVTPLDSFLAGNTAQLVGIAPDAKREPAPKSDHAVPQSPIGTYVYEIKKGETVIDPPLVDSLKYKALTTTAEFRNFTPLKGDYIKWNGGYKDIVWTYDGEQWCAPHQKNKHISIPLGHFAFVYGRLADVTSKLTLVGFVDPEKVKAREAK